MKAFTKQWKTGDWVGRDAFTLIELLIVVAVIAVLAVVVILVLNPAQLLAQSRDSNRESDMATINEALAVFAEDQPTGSLGTSSIIYLSIPDLTATTTAGSDCTALGFPSGMYHCAASSTARKVDGTGWIPVNLSLISSGQPLPEWPVDPINTTSSGYYYQYSTDGIRYEVAAFPESKKQKSLIALFKGGTGSSLIPGIVFGYVGTVQSWQVPPSITSITIKALGAGIASVNGGLSLGTLAVTPGTTYYANIGGKNGYSGGDASLGSGGQYPSGGMTWFSTSNVFDNNVILVAGGAGAADASGDLGGVGGGLTGGSKSPGGGGGGTQSAGGPAGTSTGMNSGSAGSFGQGGAPGQFCSGGGGGGYYGGGGGAALCSNYSAYPGGGGSGYISPTLTGATTTAGAGSSGNGSLVITYN